MHGVDFVQVIQAREDLVSSSVEEKNDTSIIRLFEN